MSTNIFRRLLELLPQTHLEVVTVAAIHTDGTSTVTYPGGSQTRVRGTGFAVSTQVFIREGLIEGEAPQMTVQTIEV